MARQCFIQDEDLDHSKQDYSRATIFTQDPRGVFIGEGEIYLPLTAGGHSRGDEKPLEEGEKKYEMNVIEQQIAMIVERTDNGLFAISDKL